MNLSYKIEFKKSVARDLKKIEKAQTEDPVISIGEMRKELEL